MALFTWDSRYELAIPAMDQQHQYLVKLINDMHKKKDDIDRLLLQSVVIQLFNYVEFHFKSEEDLLQKYNYNEFKEHQEEHLKILEQIKVFENDIKMVQKDNAKLKSIYIKIGLFLVDWLTDHILDRDQKYATYLKTTFPEQFVPNSKKIG